MEIEIWVSAMRTVISYLLILVVFRLMGKREIGELSILDLVVFIMLAEIAVFSIEDPEKTILHAVVPMSVLLIIQLTFAWLSMKNQFFRELVDGKPSLIIREGKIDEREMRRQRYNFDDLMHQLRTNGTENVSDVEYAVLEPSGKLSIFEKNQQDKQGPPEFITPLITDGKIQKEVLKHNDKNKDWLINELHKRGYPDIQRISFLTVNNQNEWFIDLKDEER